MKFRTTTGSVYEYEAEGPTGPRARRLLKSESSEATRPGLGEWKPCKGIIGPEIGDNAIIHWSSEGLTDFCTVTSAVVSIF